VSAARCLLAVAAAAIVALGALPAAGFAAEAENEPLPMQEGPAFIEVFLEETGWTPAEGWPPEHPSLASLQPIHWTQVEERGDVPLKGGHGQPELSVERIAAMVGVPIERLSGLAARNHAKEYLVMSRPEIVGASAAETPFVEAERDHGKPTLSFVVPPGAAHPHRIAAGVGHSLQIVMTMGGAELEITPIEFSPAEPNAGAAVEFVHPGLEGAAATGLEYSYHWDFGDGATSSEPAPKHAFPAAMENGTSNYEVTVEVVASKPDGVEIATAKKSATVPVLTTTAKPPRQEAAQPVIKAPHVRKGGGGGGRSGTSAHHEGVGGKGGTGRGGTGGKGQGGTAGTGRGIGGRAGAHEEGNPNQRGVPATTQPTHPSSTHARTHTHPHAPPPPIEKPAPRPTPGRARKPIERPPPAPVKPEPGLSGILLESLGQPLPPANFVGGSTPSPTALPLHGLVPRSQASVSTLGALGLVAGIVAVLLFVLWGAVSEIRVGWFVR
jgi:PKD domain